MVRLFHAGPLTLKDLSTELAQVVDWYHCGIQLGVPAEELDKIEHNYPQEESRCRLEMLKRWLMNDPHASWEKVITALQNMGGHGVLVSRIKQNIIG